MAVVGAGAGEAGPTPLRRYFYLSFDRGVRPREEAYFSDQPPPPGTRLDIQHTFQSCHQSFVLCGTLFRGGGPYRPAREKKYRNIGLLKSHLQKCVRKMNATIGVPTAFHYMNLDIKDFLRRLPIIMLEDASLHPSFTTLVWFMIASGIDGFLWHPNYYNYLMGIVYVILQNPVHHPLPLPPSPSGSKTLSALKTFTRYHADMGPGSKSDVSLLYAIQIRADYGGMRGDVEMLQAYADFWHGRFRRGEGMECTMKVRPIAFEETIPLKLEDWDRSAVDFHCAPQIYDYLIAKFPQYKASRDILQYVIWHYSSKTNRRIRGVEETRHREVWEVVRETLHRLQGYLLEEGY
jgi:hypothetical protein